MTTKTPRVYSDLAIPPGETLAEELEERGMTQRELAARLGRPPQVVNEIINGKKAITPDTAIGLAKVLGIEAQFWINLEADYQMTLALLRDKEALAAQEQWLSEYPIREMIQRGWIKAGRDRPSRLKALMSFFEVASIQPKVYQEAIGFRITEAAQRKVSTGALAAWLRQGEIERKRIDTADYDEQKFRDALTEIRGMTELPPDKFHPAMTKLCAEAGVAFCVVQELPKIGANGVARWLTDNKALIQMSIQGEASGPTSSGSRSSTRPTISWNYPNQRRILIDGLAPDPDMAEIEAEADRFARDFLIPPEEWNDFCDDDYFAPDNIREFAQSVGIAPGIVVGRLQKERRVPYNRLTELKQRYTWVSDAEG